MAKRVLTSPRLAKPTMPYSSATQAGNMIFVAGMVSQDAKAQIVGLGDVAAQTRQVLENVKAAVEAGGGTMRDVTKTTVYITDLSAFPAMNQVFGQYFPVDPPARATVRCELMRPEFLVEIDAIAVVGSGPAAGAKRRPAAKRAAKRPARKRK